MNLKDDVVETDVLPLLDMLTEDLISEVMLKLEETTGEGWIVVVL